MGQRFEYRGNGGELAFIMFKNVLLTVLSLGLYAAWGRTNSRRYVWGKTSFSGDRATYTGQGRELFQGWVIVSCIYIALYAVIQGLTSVLSPWYALFMYPIYVYLYSLVVYGGTRYRLSKTQWRGIHLGLDKNKAQTREFILLNAKNLLLSTFTLGLYFPVFLHEKRTFLMNKTRLGDGHFRYEADTWDFTLMFHKSVLLTFFTLGFYAPWFICKLFKYRMERTSFQGATFKVHLTGRELFFYSSVTFFLALFTFGLATPWIINWGHKLMINSVELEGEVDFEKIKGLTSEGSPSADVAASEYDIDLAF